MIPAIQPKLDALLDWMRQSESVLVAYSGGVDSAIVLAAASRALGSRSLGCIGLSPSYPKRELRAAIDLARQINASYRIVSPQEHLDSDYHSNNSDRCFFCKTALFAMLQSIARDEGWRTIADGTHADDVGDHVHGIRAADALNIRSPLRELGFTKSDVRAIARGMDLPVWNKPAMACLASRVPHGTPITPQILWQIERAEDVLAAGGFRQFRVRHHGDLARIELAEEELDRALDHRKALLAGIRAAGYRFVVLDLLAYHESPETDFVQLRLPQRA